MESQRDTEPNICFPAWQHRHGHHWLSHNVCFTAQLPMSARTGRRGREQNRGSVKCSSRGREQGQGSSGQRRWARVGAGVASPAAAAARSPAILAVEAVAWGAGAQQAAGGRGRRQRLRRHCAAGRLADQQRRQRAAGRQVELCVCVWVGGGAIACMASNASPVAREHQPPSMQHRHQCTASCHPTHWRPRPAPPRPTLARCRSACRCSRALPRWRPACRPA